MPPGAWETDANKWKDPDGLTASGRAKRVTSRHPMSGNLQYFGRVFFNTRIKQRHLEQVKSTPPEKLTWKPHAKARTLPPSEPSCHRKDCEAS